MSLHEVLGVLSLVLLAYTIALNLNYTLLLGLGWAEIAAYVRRRPLRDYDTVARSELSTPVSILVPAYDEEPVIVESVRSLLASSYRELEVVVVNDGSSDGTLERLLEAFAMAEIERVPRARLATKEVRAVYGSASEPRLVLVDKENGGKADALNAGLCHARYPLFCAVDSDTVLDRDALARLVWQFQQAPETVGVGGIVRIANGSSVRDARVVDVQTPRRLLVNLQIVEYLRAFLTGRTGWSRLGMLLIVSGAFGLFRRDTVIAAGGYDTTTVGEDAELVFRLHRHCREQGEPYKISFIADPVCWTEAPADARTLSRQRDRWQRGLVESLWRHRRMIGRPRYGLVGTVAMPYFLIFEALGPLIELIGYLVVPTAFAVGALDPMFALLYATLAMTYGLVFSFGALRIEELAFQRYRRWRCLVRLVVAAVIENFGYRQWNTLVRARACWRLVRGSRGWGEMARTGFGA
jgi:cellulose synthase/poly-beta-1,6-N-acetylglucosamine synthase-like glycosyltransferase